MRPPIRSGFGGGGGGGGRGGGGGGRFGRGGGGGRGFRGGGGGGRFGGGRFGGRGGRGEEGPPAEIVEAGFVAHECESELVCRWSLQDKVPYFNAGIFLENKRKIGKVDEVLGKISEIYFTVKMDPGVQAGSFQPKDLIYIGTDKLLPLVRFTNPNAGGGGGSRSGGRGRGGGGRGRGGGGRSPGRGGGRFGSPFGGRGRGGGRFGGGGGRGGFGGGRRSGSRGSSFGRGRGGRQ